MDLRDEILALMKTPTDRDKQRLVGASNISNLCTRCLADDMLGTPSGDVDRPFWMGAWIGTAMHNRFEADITVNRMGQGWIPEQKLTLGEIPGYGVIKSTTDLYYPPSGGTVVDFKSTTRDKLVFIKRAIHDPPDPLEVTKVTEARMKVAGYWNQVMLYGMGVRATLNLPVEKVALVFVCRDGVGDNDVWVREEDYNSDWAQDVWQRAVKLWDWLQDGGDPRELHSHNQCYFCNSARDWSK